MSDKKPDRKSFIEWNEGMIRKYDPDQYHNHPSFLVRTVEAMRCRAVRKMCGESGERSVLDVGCGAGNLLKHFDGYDYVGIDISEYILEKAVSRKREGACFVRGSVEALPFRDGSFPCVFSSEVIEHVLDPALMLSEMHRVLADGGVAVVSVPNEPLIDLIKSLVPGAGRSRDGYNAPKRMKDEWHLTEFSAAKFKTLAGEGFVIEKQVGIPSPVLPIRYVFKLRKRRGPGKRIDD
ncbi:MAG TPA: class I SAM-dependent methyltransferase [bacterium]|nr:class I SAM-dependent methyltransferase [bacterium]